MTAITWRRTATVVALAGCLALTAARCGGTKTAAPPQPTTTPTVVTTTAPPTPTPISTPTPTDTPTPTSTPSVAGLAGTWHGTWANKTPDHSTGTFTLTWTQKGSTLSGSITIGGTPCLSGGSINGHVTGSTISFGAVHGNVTVEYEGTVAGSSMSGTYHTDCGNASGSWQAKR